MFEESPSELVKHLEHPNGWWRDKAQQLIVMSPDRTVVPELEQMVRESKNLLARIHALWSLEGLGALDRMLVRQLFKDRNPRLRIQALRVSETLYKGGDKELAKDYRLLMKDTNVDVAIQAMLTANLTKIPTLEEEITALMASNNARGIQVLGEQILNPVELKGWMIDSGPELTAAQQEQMERGGVIFNELCVQCHGADGTGTSLGNGTVMAPPLTGSPRVQSHPEYVIKTLLHGLEGPLDGQTYPGGLMVGMGDQSDDWIADIASYIRVNLTNEASIVSPEQVAEVRLESKAQKGSYLFEELLASVPQILVPTDLWKASASHTKPSRIGGTASPSSAFNFEGWTTGERQSKGMWYQIEFPDVKTITEIHFNSPPKRRGNYRDRIPPYQSYPRDYELQVSMDGTQWNTIDAGKCDSPDTILSFAPSKTKFLRLVLTDNLKEEGEIPWSMRQLKIFGILQNEKLIN
jgi:mono/diheme cytochrome c family protein